MSANQLSKKDIEYIQKEYGIRIFKADDGRWRWEAMTDGADKAKQAYGVSFCGYSTQQACLRSMLLTMYKLWSFYTHDSHYFHKRGVKFVPGGGGALEGE